jgi:asparagine synthase (glutamine-hydrolysing)
MRGKQGYSLPIKNWLRGELRDYMEESFAASEIIGHYFDRRFVRTLIDEHMQMKANHNHVLWALLNLSVWHKVVATHPSRAAQPTPAEA